MNTDSHSQTAAFLWSVADLLRGDFKQSQFVLIAAPKNGGTVAVRVLVTRLNHKKSTIE